MVQGYTFGQYMFEVYDSMNIYVDFNECEDELGQEVTTAIYECWERGTDVDTAVKMLDMRFDECEEEEDDDGP